MRPTHVASLPQMTQRLLHAKRFLETVFAVAGLLWLNVNPRLQVRRLFHRTVATRPHITLAPIVFLVGFAVECLAFPSKPIGTLLSLGEVGKRIRLALVHFCQFKLISLREAQLLGSFFWAERLTIDRL